MALTQVSTGGIKDGTIVNADINPSAAIAASKLNVVTVIDGGNFANGTSTVTVASTIEGGNFS